VQAKDKVAEGKLVLLTSSKSCKQGNRSLIHALIYYDQRPPARRKPPDE